MGLFHFSVLPQLMDTALVLANIPCHHSVNTGSCASTHGLLHTTVTSPVCGSTGIQRKVSAHRDFSFSLAFDLSVAMSPGQTQINMRQKGMWKKSHPGQQFTKTVARLSLIGNTQLSDSTWPDTESKMDYLLPPFLQRTISSRRKRKTEYH